MPTDHDDRHDQGLLFDLATLEGRVAVPRLDRRGALRLFGGAGAGLLLAACGSGSSSGSDTTTTSTTSTTASTSSSTTTTAAAASTAAIPEETAGPFPADGSNGPDVLTESGIVRSDIRPSFGAYSGTATGVPLTIDLTLVEAGSGAPLSGGAVYLWHCDRSGAYSLYSEGAVEQNYLRGVQEAAEDGTVRFTTVVPAAYPGRWPHAHFEIFPSLSDATSAGPRLVTSQLALPQDVCEAVYATEGYELSVAHLADTSLQSDMIFSDGYDLQMASVEGDVASGLTATLAVAA